MANIALIDPNSSGRELFRVAAMTLGHKLFIAASPEELDQVESTTKFDLVVCDIYQAGVGFDYIQLLAINGACAVGLAPQVLVHTYKGNWDDAVNLGLLPASNKALVRLEKSGSIPAIRDGIEQAVIRAQNCLRVSSYKPKMP